MLATDRINVFPLNNVPGTIVTLRDTCDAVRCAKRRSHYDSTAGNGMPSAHDAKGRDVQQRRSHCDPTQALPLAREGIKTPRSPE